MIRFILFFFLFFAQGSCCVSRNQIDLFSDTVNEQRSRDSTVKIITTTVRGQYMGSGLYFLHQDKSYVLTAAHVVSHDGLVLVVRGKDTIMANVVYFDSKRDLAVLSVPKMGDWGSVEFDPIKEPPGVGEECFYSGFPNDRTMMTIGGKVAGYTRSGNIILNSYAWSGSSGSAVFDSKGRILGVVSAIVIGPDFTGIPTIIQNVVIVIPITALQFEF